MNDERDEALGVGVFAWGLVALAFWVGVVAAVLFL